MSRAEIDLHLLEEALDCVGEEFATLDVSEQRAVLAAHPELATHQNWNALVGGALKDHAFRLGIREIEKVTPRGSEWQKRGVRAIELESSVRSLRRVPPHRATRRSQRGCESARVSLARTS